MGKGNTHDSGDPRESQRPPRPVFQIAPGRAKPGSDVLCSPRMSLSGSATEGATGQDRAKAPFLPLCASSKISSLSLLALANS